MGRQKRNLRGKRRRDDAAESPDDGLPAAADCWLCARPLGRRVEWHHPWPKSRGGRETVPVHPICHRTIHACFTNKELEVRAETGEPLGEQPDMARFLAWIANKPPDFHAPTRGRR